MSAQRTDDPRQSGRQTCRKGVQPWTVITKELMFKHRQTRCSWPSDKHADPSAIYWARRWALEPLRLTRTVDGSLQLRSPEPYCASSRGIVQVHRLQSTQPSVRVTFTKSVFLWRTLLSLHRNPKIYSCKSFLFLIRGGTRHRWRQELWVDLQGLPARIYFKSHNWMCVLTVLRGHNWDNPSYFLYDIFFYS